MKKPRLSRQQRREQRQREDRSTWAVNASFKLPPGVSEEQFRAIAAQAWSEVTGGAGVTLVDGKEVRGGA
jgi:hypothetical protein